jgi:hypothetical protein
VLENLAKSAPGGLGKEERGKRKKSDCGQETGREVRLIGKEGRGRKTMEEKGVASHGECAAENLVKSARAGLKEELGGRVKGNSKGCQGEGEKEERGERKE